jgi:alkanesulfonate monooxygenase SsuD/methylene tetrahydromethanopterin reductase-like flavin-dependent oxidoreductase (luciferase family)/putative sterol carrier protein
MLDLLSGGRVEFGSGEGSSQMELGGFGVDRDTKRAQWAEALDVITRMLVEEPFAGHHGRWVDVPPRNVVPKPRQRPHPPLWLACSRRDTVELAARRGLGALSFSFIEPEDAKPWVETYYELLASAECVPAGFSVNPGFAVVVPFACHRDEETAIERGIDGGHFFGYSLGHYYAYGEHRPGRTSVWDEFDAYRHERGFARDLIRAEAQPLGMRALQQGIGSLRGAVGTPDQIADLAARYEAAGVDQVILVAQAGRNRHADVCEGLELFATEVLPRFAADADDREAVKREWLDGAVERALARRLPARAAPAAYTVTPQGEPAAAPSSKRPHGRPGLSVRRGARRAREAALGAVVRRAGEQRLARYGSSPVALGALFKGMAALYDPERAAGFQGEVQYDLTADGRTERWTLFVDGRRARARRGPAAAPAVTLRASVADFLRIAGGELSLGRAAIEERLEIDGDLGVATRLPRCSATQGLTY